jgi:hypothetical protein
MTDSKLHPAPPSLPQRLLELAKWPDVLAIRGLQAALLDAACALSDTERVADLGTLASIRNAALEEAAKVCEQIPNGTMFSEGYYYAKAIRALKKAAPQVPPMATRGTVPAEVDSPLAESATSANSPGATPAVAAPECVVATPDAFDRLVRWYVTGRATK